MRYRLIRSLFISVLTGSLALTGSICDLKMLSAETPSCHVSSGTAKHTCCDTSAQSRPMEMKCCPKPASQAKTFLLQTPQTLESSSPVSYEASFSKVFSRAVSKPGQTEGFFTANILQTTYSYHSPPLL